MEQVEIILIIIVMFIVTNEQSQERLLCSEAALIDRPFLLGA